MGLIFAGPLADAIGVEKLFVIGGLGSLICGLAMWLMPSVRQYDVNLQARLAAETTAEIAANSAE